MIQNIGEPFLTQLGRRAVIDVTTERELQVLHWNWTATPQVVKNGSR